MPPAGHFSTRCGDALDAHSSLGATARLSDVFASFMMANLVRTVRTPLCGIAHTPHSGLWNAYFLRADLLRGVH
jgi:hypothetical protein